MASDGDDADPGGSAETEEDYERRIEEETASMQAQILSDLRDATETTEVEPGAMDDEEDAIPNTVFVPLKVTPPEIDRREFAIYLFMLWCFTYNITTQNFQGDFEDTKGVQAMINIDRFTKIRTMEDYYSWYPSLLHGLETWEANSMVAMQSGVSSMEHESWEKGTGVSTSAVIVGAPYFTQVRCASAQACDEIESSFQSKSSLDQRVMRPGVVEPFNATGDQQCPWALDNVSYSCYAKVRQSGASSSWAYYVPRMHEILNGTVEWDPRGWISSDTIGIGHTFTVFIPSTRRFAVSELTVVRSDTGGLTLHAEVETHEPFSSTLDPHDFYIEMIFYCGIVVLFLLELTEVWDCICHSELIIPLQIVARSLRLTLLEVAYFHERSGGAQTALFAPYIL